MLELDEEVEVALAWPIVASRSGAEKLQAPNVEVPAELFDDFPALRDLRAHDGFSMTGYLR